MNTSLTRIRPFLPTHPFALCWLRRDLRLHDHHALSEALQAHPHVLPLFIFDTNILEQLPSKKDPRVHFIHTQLSLLHKKLASTNHSLLVLQGKPLPLFQTLLKNHPITAIYANEDYEPYAHTRDNAIKKLCDSHKISFQLYKDQVIFSPDEVTKKNGAPYTIYTAYMKQWKKQYLPAMSQPFPVTPHQAHLLHAKQPLPLPTLSDIGFQPTTIPIPPAQFDTNRIHNYHLQRDTLSPSSTTHLGIHLRFGTISIRKATQVAHQHNETWLNQLIWRNFFMAILAHYPHVVNKAFKPAYDRIQWQHNVKHFHAWCNGHTGFPLVDAGMRELNTTGLMHNRARMVTASFLTKLLRIDWRWGEAYFAEKLLDYELASNNGNWQWAAGTGCDAAPYFRIFNPERQAARFDPQNIYIKKWVPELHTPSYPKPIINYSQARINTIEAYKKALKKT